MDRGAAGLPVGVAPSANEHTWSVTAGTQEQSADTSPQPISAGPNPTATTMIDATNTYVAVDAVESE